MSVLFIDNTCDMWYTEYDKLRLECINMPYFVNEKEMSYDLGREFDFEKFNSDIRKGLLVSTSEMNTKNYMDVFEPHLQANEDILYLHFSSKISNTFMYLNEAIEKLKEKYPNNTITPIDTENISMGYAIIAYEVGILHKRGATDQEIFEYVKNLKDSVATYCIVDDMLFLEKGGKYTSDTKSVGGGMLGIKNIITMNMDGNIEVADKVNGKKKAILKLVERLHTEGQNLNDYPIGICYSADEENAEYLKQKILEIVGEDSMIWLQPMNPIITAHVGYGSILLSFHTSKKRF